MEGQSFKIFLFISIIIHLCFILLVSKFSLKPTVDQTLSIEITHLPQNNKPKAEKSPPPPPQKKATQSVKKATKQRKSKLAYVGSMNLVEPHKDLKSQFRKREDTILLNTKNPKYLPYSSRIKRKIESVWEYPSEARKKEIEGRLTLMFSILTSGSLDQLQLMQSSGFQVLDDAAIDAVRSAAPYYPIPSKMGIDTLNIIATFDYRIDYLQ